MTIYILILILIIFHSVYFLLNRILVRGLKRISKQDSNQNIKDSDLNYGKKISVLISVRNEEMELGNCLDGLVSQSYPADKYEIILVNDRSTDTTPDIIKEYQNQCSNLIKTIDITQDETSQSPKKYALSKGIELCTGDIILSTDGDCRFTPNWLQTMAELFDSNTGMVMGPVAHYHIPGMSKPLYGVQALEFFSHTVVSSSLIGNQFPINGSANNMAYLKEAFDQAGGFTSNQDITSGDDDFLLQKIFSLGKWKVKFSTNPDSLVFTRPCISFRQIWEQRKRWASKCSLYEPSQVAFLSYVYTYYLMIFLLSIAGIFSCSLGILGVFSWVLKSLMDYSAMRTGARLFGQEKLLNWFIPAAIIQIPMIIFAVIFGSFGHFTWKGQKVKKKIS